MAEQRVSFKSQGLTLAGIVRVPDGVKASERRPAFIVLHGFGSRMTAANVLQPCAMFEKLGYVTLRFDMPGCGESEGEKGRLICLDQVQATSDGLTLLAQNANVDPARVGVIGSSFGAAVAVYTGGVDKRRGDGDLGLRLGPRRAQVPRPASDARKPGPSSPPCWRRASATARTGQSLMVPRYDIVPIPEHLRTHVVPGSIQMFPAETAQSMFDFRAEEVVGNIAPRPLLLLHSSDDHVTPVEQSIGLFAARRPADRIAPVRRHRSLHVRGSQHARASRRARLAGELLRGGDEGCRGIARLHDQSWQRATP